MGPQFIRLAIEERILLKGFLLSFHPFLFTFVMNFEINLKLLIK